MGLKKLMQKYTPNANEKNQMGSFSRNNMKPALEIIVGHFLSQTHFLFYAYIFSSPTNEKEKTVNLTCDATTSPTFLRKTNSTKRKCSHIKGYNHSRRRRYPIQRTDSDGSSFTNSIRRKLDVQSYVDYFWPQISGMVHRPSKYQ